MCDCYTAKCAVRRCDTRIPMHIGDFSCHRSAVLVFCDKHLEQMRKRFATISKRVKQARYSILSYQGEEEDADLRGKLGLIVTDPRGHNVYPNIFGDHTVIDGNTI
jgi:hypothetical protein